MDSENDQALRNASAGGHEGAVHVLIEAGASVDLKSRWEQTALQIASCSRYAIIVQMLVAAGAQLDKVKRALRYVRSGGREGVVRALIESGASVDTTSNRGQTTLQWHRAKQERVRVYRQHPECHLKYAITTINAKHSSSLPCRVTTTATANGRCMDPDFCTRI
jgi:hypothetical protein